jgi:hypothetical protein
MAPATPEEEELDKHRKEMQAKYGGINVRSVGYLQTFP